MSLTLRDLISENLEFEYQIHWDFDEIHSTKFDYQFKVRFKNGMFEHADNGDFLEDILKGSIDVSYPEAIKEDIRGMILDKCEDLMK